MKILVVIDTQNDFIDGALRNEEAIKRVPNIVNEIKNTDADYIFLTKDTHYNQSYLNTMEGKKLPVKHCIEGSDGWQINKDIMEAVTLNNRNNWAIVHKNTFGYTGWKEKLEILKNTGYYWVLSEELEFELVGYCTDICVISNAMILKATFPNAKIEVKESCCAGVTEQSHKNALEAMKMCHIDII